MTGPERQAPSLPSVGDRRGLTAAGAVVVTLVLGLVGGAVDLVTGSGLRELFAVSFVVGCAFASLTVHREDLFATVVIPPLVYLVLVFLAGVVERTAGAASLLTRQAIDLVNALVMGAPVLMTATGLAALIATVRWLGSRG